MNYYIIVNGQQTGPFSVEQLSVTGINPDTMVWTEGMPEWAPAWQVSELSSVLKPVDASAQPSIAPVQPEQQPMQQPMQPKPSQAQQAAYANAAAPQQQTQWPQQQPKKKKRSGWLIFFSILGVFLIAAGVLYFTNPSKEQHMEKLKSVMTEAMNKVDTSKMDEDTKMGMQLGMSMMSKMFDQMFEYHNYVLFSTVTEKASDTKVSTGFLGTIKISNEEKIAKAFETFNDLSNSSSSNSDNVDDTDDTNSTDDLGIDDNDEDNSFDNNALPDEELVDEEVTF